ncbi:hypothetical protein [Deinococcus sp. PEB2-63]
MTKSAGKKLKSQRRVQFVVGSLKDHLEARHRRQQVEWALNGERIRRQALLHLKGVQNDAQKGLFTPEPEDLEIARQCCELLAALDVQISAALVEILALPEMRDYLVNTPRLSRQVRKHVLAGKPVGAGSIESLSVLICLEQWRLDKAKKERREWGELERAVHVERPVVSAKKKPEVRPPQKPGPDTPIYWEEPDPMPRPQSRLEVHRERLKTLAARVAEQEYRDTFGRGPQPRSQFRRFRN